MHQGQISTSTIILNTVSWAGSLVQALMPAPPLFHGRYGTTQWLLGVFICEVGLILPPFPPLFPAHRILKRAQLLYAGSSLKRKGLEHKFVIETTMVNLKLFKFQQQKQQTRKTPQTSAKQARKGFAEVWGD